MPPLADPVKLARLYWPQVRLCDYQQAILWGVADDDETVVPACNMAGKDFAAAVAVLTFVLSRHPVRVVTTSADHAQLEAVLWGEIRRLIETAAVPLDADHGGPLIVNHLHLRKTDPDTGRPCPRSYCIGRTAAKGEGMLGHHLASRDGVPRTLIVIDEASGVEDVVYERCDTWAGRKLIIGNTYDGSPGCTFFKRLCQGGDVPRPGGGGLYRRVIRVRAADTPNVRYAAWQQSQGIEPTGETITPGVLPWHEYLKRRATWDEQRQRIGLDAEFYEGAALKLFPPDALLASATRAAQLAGTKRRAKAAGVDPGEGGAETALYAVDELGVLDELAVPTPDTADIPGMVIDFLTRNGVPDHACLVDRGGGGKQAYDQLRRLGRNVRTLAFGAAPAEAGRDRGVARAAYLNVRAQMYGELSELVRAGFALPAGMVELRRQLAAVPRLRDGEGRLWLPPKNRRTPGGREMTMTQLVGCSPDRADALCLAAHALLHPEKRPSAGAW